MTTDATILDFLRRITDGAPENLDRSPEYITAVQVLIPDFDPDNGDPVLEAFENQIAHTILVAEYAPGLEAFEKQIAQTIVVAEIAQRSTVGEVSKIGEEHVRLAAGIRGGFYFPAILPGQFRHSKEAFQNFTLESMRFRCKSDHQFSGDALRVLQTIFEALQDDVITVTTFDGGRKLWLESPIGVAREIFAMDWDAVGIIHEEDDAEIFQLDDSSC
jgi:hypothetical protein